MKNLAPVLAIGTSSTMETALHHQPTTMQVASEQEATPAAPPHSRGENLAAIITASAIMSLGLYLLKCSGATTGGTDGVALLISNLTGLDLAVAVILVAIPFYLLGYRYKGRVFVARSVLVTALISGMTYLAPMILGPMQPSALYGALMGNILVGLGVLILLRHDAIPAGFVIISSLMQEKKGWRAGYVQAAIDVVVVSTALTYAPFTSVLCSGIGALMVGFILATNHRPGRYVGSQATS